MQRDPGADFQGLSGNAMARTDKAARVVDDGAAGAALHGDALCAGGVEAPVAAALVHRDAVGQGEVVADVEEAAGGEVAAEGDTVEDGAAAAAQAAAAAGERGRTRQRSVGNRAAQRGRAVQRRRPTPVIDRSGDGDDDGIQFEHVCDDFAACPLLNCPGCRSQSHVAARRRTDGRGIARCRIRVHHDIADTGHRDICGVAIQRADKSNRPITRLAQHRGHYPRARACRHGKASRVQYNVRRSIRPADAGHGIGAASAVHGNGTRNVDDLIRRPDEGGAASSTSLHGKAGEIQGLGQRRRTGHINYDHSLGGFHAAASHRDHWIAGDQLTAMRHNFGVGIVRTDCPAATADHGKRAIRPGKCNALRGIRPDTREGLVPRATLKSDRTGGKSLRPETVDSGIRHRCGASGGRNGANGSQRLNSANFPGSYVGVVLPDPAATQKRDALRIDGLVAGMCANETGIAAPGLGSVDAVRGATTGPTGQCDDRVAEYLLIDGTDSRPNSRKIATAVGPARGIKRCPACKIQRLCATIIFNYREIMRPGPGPALQCHSTGANVQDLTGVPANRGEVVAAGGTADQQVPTRVNCLQTARRSDDRTRRRDGAVHWRNIGIRNRPRRGPALKHNLSGSGNGLRAARSLDQGNSIVLGSARESN